MLSNTTNMLVEFVEAADRPAVDRPATSQHEMTYLIDRGGPPR